MGAWKVNRHSNRSLSLTVDGLRVKLREMLRKKCACLALLGFCRVKDLIA